MTLSTSSTSGERILEAALNRCLPRYQISVRATRVGDIFASVILQDYPQCRGDGPTVVDALRAARQGYNHLLDCRAGWMIQAALTEGYPRASFELQAASGPPDGPQTATRERTGAICRER
jgi:hypothetical protein